jgi:hypothetical protein
MMIRQNRIKTVLTLVAVAMALVGSVAQAGLLVYEPFDYTPETKVNGTPVTGTGLIGNWTSNRDNTNCRWEAPSLTYGTLPVVANRIRFHANSSPWAQASIDPSVLAGHLDDGDVLWFSVITNTGGTNTSPNHMRFKIGTDDGNAIGFDINRTSGKIRSMRAATWVGGIETLSPLDYTFTNEPPPWVVGKITFGSTDTIDIYMPALDLVLPAAPVATLSGTLDQLTFGMIRFVINNGNSEQVDELRIGTTYGSVGGVPLDPNLPEVDAGVDIVTWSGRAVQLDPNIVEAPGSDWTDLTYLWTAEPDDGVGFDPNEFVEAPAVTITKATDNPSAVTLTLAVNNEGRVEPPVTDTMTIDVYDDSCLAAKAVGLATIDPTDVDENCITNFADFAVMATTWLLDYTLTAPEPK